MSEPGSTNPFIRYRWLLDSYRQAMTAGWSDSDFLGLVGRLDEAVATVEGHGFSLTPLTKEPQLAAALGMPTDSLWIKDETGNVAGSHKARHLFGVLLHHAIDDASSGELAIASCGNAAVAAAVVARAVERPLRVFIPTWADETVVALLRRLEARIEVAERRPGESGDPTYLRFLEAIGVGLIPFSVQSTATPAALDGGRTLGWELAEQLALARVQGIVHLFIQVGGGALAASTWQGVNDGMREQWLSVEPILHTVQTEAAAPLNRTWHKLQEHSASLEAIADWDFSGLGQFLNDLDLMEPWEPVGTSAASGILDDVCYDWVPVTEAMIQSGGRPLVVNESMILKANLLARTHTEIPVDHTGTAGLSALLDPRLAAEIGPDEHVVVLFTGLDRTHHRQLATHNSINSL